MGKNHYFCLVMVRLITCHILCLLLLIAPACQHRSAYRAGGDGRGYASKIDTITKIDSTETDSLNGEKKLLHQRLDAFHKKMTKKNNTFGYGYSYVAWIAIIGGVVFSLWLAVNGFI